VAADDAELGRVRAGDECEHGFVFPVHVEAVAGRGLARFFDGAESGGFEHGGDAADAQPLGLGGVEERLVFFGEFENGIALLAGVLFPRGFLFVTEFFAEYFGRFFLFGFFRRCFLFPFCGLLFASRGLRRV